MLGDARLASEFADAMLEKGIYVIGFSYPVVPKGEARIRVQLSAAHTPEQVPCLVLFSFTLPCLCIMHRCRFKKLLMLLSKLGRKRG